MADHPQDAVPNSTPSPQPPPDLPEGTIHLKVKTPHGSLSASIAASTFSLGAVPVTSTIGAIRQQIQQTLPTNPAPLQQRLLYAGRVLHDDAETVQDALNIRRSPEQREYVIHLVVRGEAGESTEPPARPVSQVAQVASGSNPLQQNAMQQHHQIHQRLHQQHVAQAQAQAQQAAFSPFTWAGMQGSGMPMQGPMGMGLAQQQQHGVGFDPATLQRLQMQQAQMQQGHPAATQTPLVNGTNNRNVTPPPPESIPLPPSGPSTRDASSPLPQADAQPQSQNGPQRPEGPTQPGQHHHQHVNGNFRAELRGPNGERWEFQQHTFQLPHPQHPGHGSAYVMTNHGPPAQPQQMQPGMQAHAARPMPPPPHFAPPGWAPGMPAIPGIPQINIPHIQMPQIGIPMQGQWPPQQFHQPRMAGTDANAAGPRAPTGPSALDRARSNMAEMRRMLDDLRSTTQQLGAAAGTSQTQSDTARRIGEIEQRMRDVESYIDPLGFGVGGNARNAGDANTNTARSTTPAGINAQRNRMRLPLERLGLEQRALWSSAAAPQPATNSQDVTAYLLSSPNGPQAILYSPQHGAYTSSIQPTPTRTQPQPTQQAQHQQPDQVHIDPAAREAAHRFIQDVAAQRLAGAQAMAAGRDPALQEPLAPLQPLIAHFWLLLRVLIFAYFLLGSDMSYTKMLMLAGVGLAFWAFRLGVLGNPEIMNQARRWWDGVVGLPERAREQPGAGQDGQQQDEVALAGQAGAAQPAEAQHGQQRMPTPEQVAQRLLNENAEQNRGWLREQIRPVERAVALFVASLWPGIGEAHVRAQRELREQEERRAAEAEVEARRRAEEERGAEEKKDGASSMAGVQAEKVEDGGEKEQTSVGESSAVEGGDAPAAQ